MIFRLTVPSLIICGCDVWLTTPIYCFTSRLPIVSSESISILNGFERISLFLFWPFRKSRLNFLFQSNCYHFYFTFELLDIRWMRKIHHQTDRWKCCYCHLLGLLKIRWIFFGRWFDTGQARFLCHNLWQQFDWLRDLSCMNRS